MKVASQAPPKPRSAHIIEQDVDAIPPKLIRAKRWVVWQWIWRPDKQKYDKPPIDPETYREIDQTDPKNWRTFQGARRAALKHGDGIGIALGPKDDRVGIVGIDLDQCIDADGNIAPWAREIVERFGSYTERTPSGKGLRILIWGDKPGPRCKTTKFHGGNVELYESDRYLTVTGRHLEGTPTQIVRRDDELKALYEEMFAEKPKAQTGGNGHSKGHVDPTDDELIERARRARNGPKFSALFDRGDTSGYAGDDSAADQALANHLAFWLDRDFNRIEAMFGRSALGQRDKWTGRADYRQRTIDKAIDDCDEVYKPGSSGKAGSKGPSANGDGHHRQDATGEPTNYEALTEAQMGVEWAKDIEDEQIEWINEWRLAAGKLHILAGAGGLGKSQHMIAEAAAVSNGTPFPDGGACLRSGVVLILAAEDGKADTIKPRLRAAGADMGKVAILRTTLVIPGKDGKPPLIDFVNFQNLPYWEALFKKLSPVLIIADPVPAFLGRGVNDHRNADVRQVLEPFVDLMGKYRVAMEAGTHVGKSTKDKSATDQILGSVAYGNLARRINITWIDPDCPGRYIVTNPKLSVGPKQPALAYAIEPFSYESGGKVISTSRLKFEEKTFAADEYELAQGQKDAHRGRKRGPDPAKMNELVRFLFDFMKGKGPVLLGEIGEAAGKAELIGSQVWDEKKGRYKWSNFSALYDAAERVAELPAPDDGWVIITSKVDPDLRSTSGHARWLLRRADAAF